MPNALNTAAVRGTITCLMPGLRAAPQTVIGPAPPKAAITVSGATSLGCAVAVRDPSR